MERGAVRVTFCIFQVMKNISWRFLKNKGDKLVLKSRTVEIIKIPDSDASKVNTDKNPSEFSKFSKARCKPSNASSWVTVPWVKPAC